MSEGGKRSAWMTHVKRTMKAHSGLALRDVLKMAKKTYKGGTLMDKMGPMGGARKHVGGQLYSFAGGPYTDSVLADGAAPFKFLPDATWQGPSELKGGGEHPLAPVAEGGEPAEVPFTGEPTSMPGGRRHRKSKKARRGRRGGQPVDEVGNPLAPDADYLPLQANAGPGQGAVGGKLSKKSRKNSRKSKRAGKWHY